MNEHIDMKISGASSMPGGEYGRVSISGAGKVQGASNARKCTAPVHRMFRAMWTAQASCAQAEQGRWQEASAAAVCQPRAHFPRRRYR